MWIYVAGLTMRYRGGPAVGIKPVRLWETREDSLGRRIFYPLGTDTLRLHNIVCHELTHAYTAHLHLPLWLNEGVAMITVDRFLERETVRHSTLQRLRTNRYTDQPADYARLAHMPEDAIVYAYVHGYWATRYLFEAYPDLLARLLAKRRSPIAIDIELARSLGTSPKNVWKEMHSRVLTHFAPLEENGDASCEPTTS